MQAIGRQGKGLLAALIMAVMLAFAGLACNLGGELVAANRDNSGKYYCTSGTLDASTSGIPICR